MDKNMMTVLIVLILAILIICIIFALMWIYTPYMGGNHHGMMRGY